MDIAVSMSSNDHPTSPYETLRPVTGPTSPSSQSHRNLQPSISDLAPAHSPRRFHPPSSRTDPSPPATFDNQDMDLTPASLAPNATQPHHHNVWRDPHSSAVGPTLDGQDHDRMETDDDSHDSSSEDDSGAHQPAAQPPVENEEMMDTTPDEPHGEETLNDHVPVPTASNPSHQALIVNAGSMSSFQDVAEPERSDAAQGQSGPHSPSDNDEQNVPGSNTMAVPMTEPIMPSATLATNLPNGENLPPDADGTRLEDASTPPPATMDEPSSPQDEANEPGEPEQQQAREDDSSQEESSDEEERPFWAEFAEDTSGPDERELKAIEQQDSEVDARNHAHWEAITYEALEDPEYIPLESGRINWTATPIHGTPEKPNRDKVMRSPSVLIGGLYWNIKYYPRGNDGTEHMSVYIECSPSPPETPDSEEGPETSPTGENVPSVSSVPRDEHNATDAASISHSASTLSEAPHQIQEVDGTDSEAESDSSSVRWEAAAQVGCVVYNPSEARVNVFRKSNHQFNPGDADWGWTRFHGPWESIHLRQRNERQALLRNDTLAFCAYIRIVKDDTKNLWWHTPKKGPGWDCYEKIGVKSLSTHSSRDANLVAAISCWLNLKPVVDLIKSTKIPNIRRKPQQRMRPLSEALQQLIEHMFGNTEDGSLNAMATTTAWIDWYITETDPPRFDLPDVVAVWECLRRLLNYEASDKGDMAAAPDCFQDIVLLKQPDPWKTESPISMASQSQEGSPSQPKEPRSVQETIDLATTSNNFRRWDTYAGNSPEPHDLPAVLQIELHRQRYDKVARRWDKLTHRIELNENITYTATKAHNRCNYTLFGMVVHSGCLESREFYSVLRPQGPGTRWIRHSGGHLHTCCLTRTQAVTAHEGEGENETGSAAVAYVVLYVRTDRISDVLIPPFPLHDNPPLEPGQKMSSIDCDSEDSVSVRIFRSTLFDSHNGRGLPDLWPSSSTKDPSSVQDLQFPKSTTLVEVAKHFENDFLAAEHQVETTDRQPTIYRWWLLDTTSESPRGLPRFHSIWDETLDKAALAHGGVRLWLHVDQTEHSMDSTDGAITRTESSGELQQAQAPSDSAADESGDAVMTQDQHVETATGDQVLESPTQTQDIAASSVGEPQESPGEDAPVAISQEQSNGGNDPEDAVMDEGQDSAVAADPTSSSLSAPFQNTIYIFVKVFNSQEQTLRAVGSRVVLRESQIHFQVTQLLGTEDKFDIYHENSRSLSHNDRIRPSRTFNDYDVRNGSIFIAHRKPTPEEIATLISQGKPSNPPSFFDYLRYNDDPGYLVSHDVNNSFGAEYTSADISNGFIHGPGTVIYMNGDAYIGNWTANLRSGHGVMAYASGDTYTGEFANNEREGRGKMVYGKTNNVYEGGWKNGRRHGKGVMRYEVADEELAMCKICYENEMDALLYDCGHVVACEECARQLEQCPVCRKN
ncbi:MAG: hypothetical protein Q9216_004617, partial [Gyalolechia sp. 2 TL-2023]